MKSNVKSKKFNSLGAIALSLLLLFSFGCIDKKSDNQDLIMSLLLPLGVHAVQTSWYTLLGGSNEDVAFSVQQTTDSGYIIAGYAKANIPTLQGKTPLNAFTGLTDMLVVKLDSTGTVAWYTFLGGPGSNDVAYSIQQTGDGGFIVAGYATADFATLQGKARINPFSGDHDMLLVKLDSAGAVAWYTFIGGPGRDVARSIQQTSDGGYIVTGDADADIPMLSGKAPLNLYSASSDMLVVKLDSAGAVSWHTFLGGAGYEVARSIQQTNDSGFILAGESASNIAAMQGKLPLNPYSGSATDMLVVKLNSAGAVAWFTFLGGTGTDVARSIQQTSDSGFIVAGYADATIPLLEGKTPLNAYSDLDDMLVVKLNSAGAVAWYTFLGGSGSDTAMSIKQTNDGNYIVAGYANDIPILQGKTPLNALAGRCDMLVVKLSSAGAVSQYTFLGGPEFDHAYSIQQTIDGGYIVAGDARGDIPSLQGKTPLNAYSGNYDFFVVKLSGI